MIAIKLILKYTHSVILNSNYELFVYSKHNVQSDDSIFNFGWKNILPVILRGRIEHIPQFYVALYIDDKL